MKRALLTAALIGFACLLVPTAAAQTDVTASFPVSETVTIPSDDWKTYRVVIGGSDSFVFSVGVTQGGDIDVYFMDARGYADYTSPTTPSFNYSVAGSRESTRSFGTTISPGAGTYYLLVDNSNTSVDGAISTGPVTVGVTARIQPFPIAIVAGGILAVLAVIIAIALVVRSRRKKRKARMPPPMMPPMQPPTQPPMQPPSSPPPGP